ncbi:MAG TPA: VOC family protein [Hyphomicrobiaceae bacterium]|nr:VOC family protein [Hyphomicrobiaceae bacterium]
MPIEALGYVGVSAKDLGDWRSYGTRHLGLQIVDKSSGSVAFRMDDRTQRVIVEADGSSYDPARGVKFFGWEVADAATLDGIAARIEAAGVKVARGTRALADERRVADLIVLSDPLGSRVEVFHGAEVASDPFTPGRNISGFRTGPLGVGHVVMTGERIDPAVAFYRDVLGFGFSDFYDKPFKARFFHVNQRHHSLALIETGRTSVHHMMMELMSFDDVGQGLDLALAEEGRLAVTLGRHAGDYMTSFYTHTPSGFMVEYGWGGKSIDPATWVATERTIGPSLWGHERSWLPPEKRAEALALRLKNAEQGERRPVQVMEGNYELVPGVCPWWDRLAAKARDAAGSM